MADYDYGRSRRRSRRPSEENYPRGREERSRARRGEENEEGGSSPEYPYSHGAYWSEPLWTYEEYWLVPGPYAGRGPKGYTRSDDQIFQDVCDRLAAHGMLDASNIEVHVENGEVTLDGTVDDRGSKRLAEDVADTVYGVEDVHNHLRVSKQGGQLEGTFRAAPNGERPSDLREGEEVVGSGGKPLGTVKEVHNQDFVLNRPMAPDVHVPFSAIRDASGNQVKLDLSAEQIDQQGWSHLG